MRFFVSGKVLFRQSYSTRFCMDRKNWGFSQRRSTAEKNLGLIQKMGLSQLHSGHTRVPLIHDSKAAACAK